MKDKGFNKYDPHRIAEKKMKAIVTYREKKREFNKLVRDKDEKEKQKFLYYRFSYDSKLSVEDAKAKARTDEEVKEYNKQLDAAEIEMDKAYAELDRITVKIELMADFNATARAEMKLGGLTP
jgi:hypothetical protein